MNPIFIFECGKLSVKLGNVSHPLPDALVDEMNNGLRADLCEKVYAAKDEIKILEDQARLSIPREEYDRRGRYIETLLAALATIATDEYGD